MTSSITLPQGVQLCHLPASFRLARGEALPGACIAYELQGPAGAPVVAVLGGISAGRHVSAHAAVPGPGWWEGVVGDGLPIDTTRFRVLAFDWLGGAGASTAPGPGERFPFVGTEDQAQALRCLCDALRIETLHAFVGCSYGGMVGLQFARRSPERVQRLCTIVAAHKSDPQASAWRAVQRGIMALGQRTGAAAEALALARALAMTTYRTPRELRERFDGPPEHRGDDVRFPVQDWLDARGAEFASRFAPEPFLVLNRSIDAHRVEPRDVNVPAWIVGVDGDQLVPAACVRALAQGLPRLRRHVELRSRYGHDAFLKELRLLQPVLREVLS